MPTQTAVKRIYFDCTKKRILSEQEIMFVRAKQETLKEQNILYFSNTLEYTIFQSLHRFYCPDEIIRDYKVSVLPSTLCYPGGKTWTMDFLIRGNKLNKRNPFFIKAQRKISEDFLFNLAALELNFPKTFSSLYLVFDDIIPRRKVLTNLNSTSYNNSPKPKILTLKEFTQLQLP